VPAPGVFEFAPESPAYASSAAVHRGYSVHLAHRIASQPNTPFRDHTAPYLTMGRSTTASTTAIRKPLGTARSSAAATGGTQTLEANLAATARKHALSGGKNSEYFGLAVFSTRFGIAPHMPRDAVSSMEEVLISRRSRCRTDRGTRLGRRDLRVRVCC
jgi:hypothetical protein